MFYNEYTPFFRKIPLTIQDQSNNLLQFFESKTSLESPKLETRLSAYSEEMRQSLLKEVQTHSTHLSESLLRQLSRDLLSIPPSTFQKRTFIGFTDFLCLTVTSIPFTKRQSSFDEDGNLSLFTLFIVLDAQEIHEPITCQTLPRPTPILPTARMTILIDHRIHFCMPLNPNGHCTLLQCKCLYSLLPETIFSLSMYDQIVLWRGRMRKCFTNSGTFLSCSSQPLRQNLH